MTYQFICLVCKKEFTSYQPNAKYCSDKCKNRKHYLPHPYRKKKECIICQKEFIAKTSNAIYCQKCQKCKKYGITLKDRYSIIKSGAEKRNLDWQLSENDFLKFWQKPCHYCGEKIEIIGLDRIDNSKGYILDNINSCCAYCNKMKSNHTEKEFIEHCFKIVKIHIKER